MSLEFARQVERALAGVCAPAPDFAQSPTRSTWCGEPVTVRTNDQWINTTCHECIRAFRRWDPMLRQGWAPFHPSVHFIFDEPVT